jgi:hypothetical protein
MGRHDTERDGQELRSPQAAWDYPWTSPGESGLLTGGRFRPTPAGDLLREFAGRAAVVAVGSNASPEALHRKLGGQGGHGVVPVLPAGLLGCAVGHSAHVSVPGFVAAAPYRSAYARTAVFVSLLDEEQLVRLDATEPNYQRRRFTSGDALRLELEPDGGPETFHLYDGRWGVIAPPGGSPVPFGTQRSLHELLRVEWPPYVELLGSPPLAPSAGVEDRMRLLAADQNLRTAVREALYATGWARPSDLAD